MDFDDATSPADGLGMDDAGMEFISGGCADRGARCRSVGRLGSSGSGSDADAVGAGLGVAAGVGVLCGALSLAGWCSMGRSSDGLDEDEDEVVGVGEDEDEAAGVGEAAAGGLGVEPGRRMMGRSSADGAGLLDEAAEARALGVAVISCHQPCAVHMSSFFLALSTVKYPMTCPFF